nr:DUF397 domain-containing protein [Micromonospora sp. DSM 115978]
MRPDTPWITSTRSGGNGGECVETRRHDGRTEVRDSKDRSGPVLTFSHTDWTAFTAGLRTGSFES